MLITNIISQWLHLLMGYELSDIVINLGLLCVVFYYAYKFLLYPGYTLFVRWWRVWLTYPKNTVFLEITPPEKIEKNHQKTRQLLALLRDNTSERDILSLEMISSYEEGLRYRIQTHPDKVKALQRHIASYLPHAKFKLYQEDLLLSPQLLSSKYVQTYHIKQANHYAYPLHIVKDQDQNDPFVFMMGAMSELDKGDAVVLQMLLTPYQSHRSDRLYNRIHHKGYDNIGQGLTDGVRKYWWLGVVVILITYYTYDIHMALSWGVILLVVSWINAKRDKGRKLSFTNFDRQLFESILNKLGEPLFKANIRVVLVSDSVNNINGMYDVFKNTLSLFDTPTQHLCITERRRNNLLVKRLKDRAADFLNYDSGILSLSELASIYHLPSDATLISHVVHARSPSLDMPLAMENATFDIIFGHNYHRGNPRNVGLTLAERERHVFIIGGTGNGKTTMLEYAIIQDMQNNKGIAVIDPHGDMAENLLRYVPKHRVNDVIYFNPDDLSHPIGLNLLEVNPEARGDELLRDKDLITESVISIFRKIFSEEGGGGHRVEYVLRNAVQTALTIEGSTLFTIFDLLNDPKYRAKVVSRLEDENLSNFWKNEIGRAGNFQQVKMMAGITAKIGRFLFSASTKRSMEQSVSTINFDDILDGKILICNFSKGLLGEDASELFGITILAKIQLAALRRARVNKDQRVPFYLYVDEFQNFATPSFVEMLSEARKYKLFLTMAEQTTSQQSDRQQINIILANVGTVICFRSGNMEDEKLMLPLFKPYVTAREISNLPAYDFFMRASGKNPQEPLSGTTVLIQDKGSGAIRHRVVATSRKNYSVKFKPNQANANTVKDAINESSGAFSTE